MTFDEWWVEYTTPEMRADLKAYYGLTFETLRSIVEKEGICPSSKLDIKIHSYPIAGRTLGFKFAFISDGEILHERELTPKTMLGPGDLFEEDAAIPRYFSNDGKLYRKYGGKLEAGQLVDGEVQPDEVK